MATSPSACASAATARSVCSSAFCRHAAYACPVSKKIYDTMKRTNSPIGLRLHIAQKTSIENLWKRASALEGSPARMGLPGRGARRWFQQTFCGGETIEGAECWPYVTTFNSKVTPIPNP